MALVTSPQYGIWRSRLSRTGQGRRSISGQLNRARPRLEPLEERTLLSTFMVTDNSDNPSDTESIRYAIDQLSAAGSNTISFAPLLAGGNTITLNPANGPLTVHNGVTIDGIGSSDLTISGGGSTEVFDVEVPSNTTVSINNLTIQDGLAPRTGTHFGQGGGLYSNGNGSLQLSNLVMSNNLAIGSGAGAGQGGAVFIAGGTASITHCTISTNLARGGSLSPDFKLHGGSGQGGGVYAAGGTIIINNSTIVLNQAVGGQGGYGAIGGDGQGGGLYLGGPTVAVTVTGSDIYENQALGGPGYAGGGGGIGGGGYASVSSIAFTGATITANSATGGNGQAGDNGATNGNGGPGASGGDAQGGGVFLIALSVNSTNSKFTNNHALGGNGGSGGDGDAGDNGGPGHNGGPGGFGGNAQGGGLYVGATV